MHREEKRPKDVCLGMPAWKRKAEEEGLAKEAAGVSGNHSK